MPTVEDYQKLVGQQKATADNLDRYQKVLAKVWDDPELGPAVRKAAKEVLPNLRTPADDVSPILEPLRKQNDSLAAELKAMREEREAEKKAREERDKAAADADFERKINEARKSFNLTDEGFDKMVAHMKATGNYTDPMGAAALIVSQNPPPPPPGPMYGASDLNFAGSGQIDENYRLLHESPERYLDAEIRKAWDPRTARDYVAKEMGEQYANLAFGR